MSEVILFHPLANIFPLIEGAAFDELVADVKASGLRETIVLHGDGTILDGRNRYRACVAAGVDARFEMFQGGDALAFVISKNLTRRHLSDGQRASVAAKIANLSRGRPSSENPPNGGFSTEHAAATLNVAPRQVERARVVHESGVTEVREALDRGDLAVSVAEKIARMPEQEQPAELKRHLPNGARAIMGSRQEPDDSLDYAPTPPWGTRALIEIVLPTIGISPPAQVWEPACGEGHIAEVLTEYCGEVIAGDVHDYGYGLTDRNFLSDRLEAECDWVITNPPFKAAEEFSLQALKFARIGVAMFVRWQWIETVGRFNRLFKPYPPTMVAVFAERIPLHMGRWEPDGDTATAYCWVVWHKASPSWGTGLPTLLSWIPPGQREALTHSDDAERFTAHPVIKRKSRLADDYSPTDLTTGEILNQSEAAE